MRKIKNNINQILHIPEQRTVIQKTLEHFGDQLKVWMENKKHGKVLYNASLEATRVSILLQSIFDEGSNETNIHLHKAALCLRKSLLEVKGNLDLDLLPRSLTAQYFKQGMAPIPKKCLQIFTSVLCSDSSNPTEKETRLAHSLS